MRKKALLFFMLSAVFPLSAKASLVDPSLIPDGEYKVTVEKVVDGKHIVVKMDNGIESEVPATKTLTFDAAEASRNAKIFIYKGLVITFKAG